MILCTCIALSFVMEMLTLGRDFLVGLLWCFCIGFSDHSRSFIGYRLLKEQNTNPDYLLVLVG